MTEFTPPPDSISSAIPGLLICIGHAPVAGCGAVLTDEERHYYGDSCENCARAWGEAIARWREGGNNPELDKMFSAPAPKAN